MDKVRLGIIGVGGMGTFHYDYLKKDEVKRCEVTAVCDIDESKLAAFSDFKTYTDSAELIRSGEVAAVIIATPHYAHTTIGIDALEQGLHVLVEKPISVHKADCERLIAAHTNKDQVFAAMFQMRTEPIWAKVKQVLERGELGEIVRINWIATHWFRSEAYYASGGWRATWSGEGGGVLLNQCPHNLDMMQWLFGMPAKMRGFCGFGMKHNIEVEDEVTAYMEYPNGATGIFIASTSECPGTNRLEICGERGKIVVEGGSIHFTRNEIPTMEYSRSTNDMWGRPGVWEIDIPIGKGSGGHKVITQNFVDAILDGTPLIAPAEEGINSVELANSMVYSSLNNATVDFPLDSVAYEATLKDLCENSKFVKKVISADGSALTSSFQK